MPLPCGKLHDDAIQAGTTVQRLVSRNHAVLSGSMVPIAEAQASDAGSAAAIGGAAAACAAAEAEAGTAAGGDGVAWTMVSVQDGIIKKPWSAQEERKLTEIMRDDGAVVRLLPSNITRECPSSLLILQGNDCGCVRTPG